MIREFSDAQLGQLMDGLKTIATRDLPAHIKLNEELACIRRSTEALSKFVEEHSFADLSEEINYHKNIYPSFRCLYIYHANVHKLNADLPDWDRETLLKYYEQKQHRIRKQTKGGRHHFMYFKLRADDLDELYFRTDPGRHSVLLPILSEPVECCTTAMGCLFARFRAAGLLYSYIQLRKSELDPKTIGTKTRKGLKWTGDVIHLIELAHGLHLSKEVNGGRLGVVEFFSQLGEMFGVDLGVPRKGFDNIKSRKRLSQTHFTDGLRDNLRKKMTDEDVWKAHS